MSSVVVAEFLSRQPFKCICVAIEFYSAYYVFINLLCFETIVVCAGRMCLKGNGCVIRKTFREILLRLSVVVTTLNIFMNKI